LLRSRLHYPPFCSEVVCTIFVGPHNGAYWRTDADAIDQAHHLLTDVGIPAGFLSH
jgi:hypothetical protein